MGTTSTTTLQIGQRLERYRIEGLLGSGGMGAVYRAHDQMLQRTVAIKVTDRADADTRRLLLQEGRLAASLSHPAICRVHAIRADGNPPFIVMEHVQGIPLSTLIQGGRGLPVDVALRHTRQLVDAVAYAHHRGVVHGDLKSANIMIEPGGTLKIVDFGLAVRHRIEGNAGEFDLETTRASGRSGAGTIPYMSPEMLRGGPSDLLSDVWAFGVVTYEMVSGCRPFTGATRYEVAAAILTCTPPPLPSHVPGRLRRIVVKCLEKSRDNRYRSGRDVAIDFEDLR
jgi:eukaryotic-like serine/threonine-protein kinase